MDVIVAKHAGFCFGVQRAVDMVYEQVKNANDQPIYTYGPIIHNEEVVADLEKHGVKVVDSMEELYRLPKGIVVNRSHGVSKDVYDKMKLSGHVVVDATCPFVKRIHNIVEQESKNGKEIVIIGNPGHPEVEGIRGWSVSPVTVIDTRDEAENLSIDKDTPICIVSQTTFNYNKFQDLVEIVQKRGYNMYVVNTICNATEERQTEAKDIAADVDVMIVIGGRHSSNSRKLFEICQEECDRTYFIQTLDDLNLELPEKAIRLVGITAGASTPTNIIEEVQNYVRVNF